MLQTRICVTYRIDVRKCLSTFYIYTCIKFLLAISQKNLFEFFRFFNPLHSKPTGEGVAPETRSKGVLYDLDGKFAYSTYSEEMRSYHPMLDIRELTKDLK